MEHIQAMKFQVEEVGKHVKGSKKRYTWEISLKQKYHTIVLDFSFISGKVKITVDRKILLENELPANVSFQYPFTLDGFALNIIQQGETFQLRINNKVFSHLFNQQMTNTHFKKYQEEVKDIKVDLQQMNPPKKMSLNIGALGGGHKKKKQASESAGWDAFSGTSGGSFPNYFGQAPKVSEEKPQQQQVAAKTSLLDQQQKVQKSNISSSLLDNTMESKVSTESIFDMNPPSQPAKVSQQFGNMQEMFSSLSVKPQPPSNSVDFFADQPKKQVPTPPVTVAPSNPNIFSFDANFSNPGVFSTGFSPAPNPGVFSTGFNPTSNNMKAFATTAPANKPLQLDFFNVGPAKQQVNLGGAFSKKPSQQIPVPTQLENMLSGKNTNPQQGDAKLSTSLTDMSVNDFMEKSSNPSQIQNNLDFTLTPLNPTPSSADFSTMQLLFQTNSLGQSNLAGSSQINFGNSPQPIQPVQPANLVSPGVPNAGNEFNTMQSLFHTTNYENLNMNRPSQVSEAKPFPDFLKDNKPQTFATLGGLGGNGGFNMASFGTMQVNSVPKGGQLDFNFLEAKSSINPPTGNGNLI